MNVYHIKSEDPLREAVVVAASERQARELAEFRGNSITLVKGGVARVICTYDYNTFFMEGHTIGMHDGNPNNWEEVDLDTLQPIKSTPASAKKVPVKPAPVKTAPVKPAPVKQIVQPKAVEIKPTAPLPKPITGTAPTGIVKIGGS